MDVRRLLRQAGVPSADTRTGPEARDKLTVAVWAAEQARTAAHIRAMTDVALSQAVFGALEVLPACPVSLQDAYADTILRTCKAAAWAADPSQNIGLSDAARMASLRLLAAIQAQGAGSSSADHELSMTLGPDEFRTFRSALAVTGRTFRDLVKIGGCWSMPAGVSATGPQSVSGTSSTCSGATQGLSGFSFTSGG